MKKVCSLLLFFCLYANAQKEGSYWYFGYLAGLNFNTSPASVLADSKIKTFEGCSTISNSNGDLLFYTDGVNVWNQNHKLIASGLSGDPSATQSAVIVPKPGSHGQHYYIFTVGNFADVLNKLSSKFEYSIIDVSIKSGDGIIRKNVPLFTKTSSGKNIFSSEKIAAVQHANGKDFWIIGHDWKLSKNGKEIGGEGNIFYVYLLTEKGLSGPKQYKIGEVHYDSRGYMKISNSGKFIAVATVTSSAWDTLLNKIFFKFKTGSFVEVFNFDNKTGVISKKRKNLPFKQGNNNTPSFYGIEFSNNEKYLYVTQRFKGDILQFDMDTGTEKTIAKDNYANALQLAPDGNIYAAMSKEQPSKIPLPTSPKDYFGEKYLGMIENADDTNPTFNPTAIHLGKGFSYEGLPTVVLVLTKGEITIGKNTCVDKPVEISLVTKNFTDYVLEFGDGNSVKGKIPSNGIIKENYKYKNSGDYKVIFTLKKGAIHQQKTKIISVFPVPNIVLEDSEIILCNTKEAKGIIQNFNANYTYVWKNSKGNIIGTGKEQIFTKPGNYNITAKNKEGCEIQKTIVVASFVPDIKVEDFAVTYSQDRGGIFTLSDRVKINLLQKKYEFAVKSQDATEYSNLDYRDVLYFENLQVGAYTFYVKEKKGCNLFKFYFSLIGFPKYFSPNADGINDVWKIKGFDERFFKPTRIYIINRDGVILADFDANQGWNGTDYNGKQMHSDDYWYKIILIYRNNYQEIKIGHFSLFR